MSEPIYCRCGGIPIIVKHTYYKLPPSYGVKCSNCEMQSFQFCKTETEAVTVWNLAMSERTAKVKEAWGLAMCCACKKRVIPYDKYCSHCGARLEWT